MCPATVPKDDDLIARSPVVLAAVDSESHLLALAQLSEMLSDEAEIEKLIQAQTPEEVLQMIHQYSKGDGVS